MPFDLSTFSLSNMLRCGLDVRRVTQGTPTMEAAASAIVAYLYENANIPATGDPACVLVRCYRTCAYTTLPPELQRFVRRKMQVITRPQPEMRCLTLLASAGLEPEWNDRMTSRDHRAIPLASTDMIAKAPMIAQLIREFGIDLASVVEPSPESTRARDGKTYNVFHVEEALGSPHIPAQPEFVEKYKVRSVVGFGGSLRTGDLYAIIMFSRVHVPASSAERFRTLALDVKSAFYMFDESAVFNAPSGKAG
jgi:hypothetical protein